jgi:hypothetical protein
MSFGLSNAPSHFSRLMMDIFKDYLDIFVLIFLDDINLLKTGRPPEAYQGGPAKLRKHRLFARADKCDWAQRILDF